MKQLWSILMDKLKQVEPNYAAMGIGIGGLFAMSMVTRIIIKFFNVIVDIVLGLSGQPLG